MIVMGAGTNHWFHSDQTYRAMLSLVLFCGCQGVNGGGWAHYVGQEKVRPLTGWQTVAFALDWQRPARQQPATPFWYLATDQWRYETFGAEEFTSPAGPGSLGGERHTADCHAQAARLGWLPSRAELRPQPARRRRRGPRGGPRAGRARRRGAARRAASASPARTPTTRPTSPASSPSGGPTCSAPPSKGHEYFLRHLLGVPDAAVRSAESAPENRPEEVRWRERGAARASSTSSRRSTSG